MILVLRRLACRQRVAVTDLSWALWAEPASSTIGPGNLEFRRNFDLFVLLLFMRKTTQRKELWQLVHFLCVVVELFLFARDRPLARLVHLVEVCGELCDDGVARASRVSTSLPANSLRLATGYVTGLEGRRLEAGQVVS